MIIVLKSKPFISDWRLLDGFGWTLIGLGSFAARLLRRCHTQRATSTKKRDLSSHHAKGLFSISTQHCLRTVVVWRSGSCEKNWQMSDGIINKNYLGAINNSNNPEKHIWILTALSVLIRINISIIQPYFEYGCHIWSSASAIARFMTKSRKGFVILPVLTGYREFSHFLITVTFLPFVFYKYYFKTFILMGSAPWYLIRVNLSVLLEWLLGLIVLLLK